MSRLAKVTRGKVKRPYGIVIYGTDGVGKTTFASKAPSPVFFGSEKGTNSLDVARFPQPESWTDLRSDVRELIDTPHDYKTAVLDSLDWAEPVLHKHICDLHNVASIELAAGGYGKGFGEASKEWRAFIADLDALRDKRDMNVVLIAHCKVVDFNDPQAQANYNRYQLKLRDADSAWFREWSDAVLFANHETLTTKELGRRPGQAVTRAVDGLGRIMHTDRRSGFDAKNRFGLPKTLPLEWSDFVAAAEAGEPEAPDAIFARIEGMLSQFTDEAKKKTIMDYVNANRQNALVLAACEDKVKAMLNV